MHSPRKIAKLVKKYMRVAPTEFSMERARSGSGSGSGSYSGLRRRFPSNSPGCSSRGSPSSSRSWEREESYIDSDLDGCDLAPEDVPEGSLAVYVGSEMRRFVIQTEYLHREAFRVLLKQSEEEFGYDSQGGLRIACDVELFEKLLWRLKSDCGFGRSLSSR
jgi:hypothetical protein